jgi:hypothetical protein
MELFNSALPNIIFIVGILAVSIGLGIELKLVPVNNQVSRPGRIGAMIVGGLLICVSIGLYIRESGQAAANAAPTPQAVTATPGVVQASLAGAAPTAQGAPMVGATAAPVANTSLPPTETPLPPTATPPPPTETPVPPSPSTVPPTETSLPPTATPAPPTATQPPGPGSVVHVTGTIQDVTIKKRESTIRVNDITYRLPSNWGEALTAYLVVGAPISFEATYPEKGTPTITAISSINNQPVEVNEDDSKRDD